MTTNKISNHEEALKASVATIVSLWFGHSIEDSQSCSKGFDLEPHAAICLMLMATKTLASSEAIRFSLGGFGVGAFGRAESSILVEYAMASLKSAGLVRLDKQGELEHSKALQNEYYGSTGVHWTLTPAGARRVAPIYCAMLGKVSEFQKQAVNEMLAANKAEIKKSRAAKS